MFKTLAKTVTRTVLLCGLSASMAYAADFGTKTEDALRAIYAGDVAKLDAMIGDPYIQHNPGAMDGKQPLLDFVTMGKKEGWFNEDAAKGFDPMRTVAEGDLAATHYLDNGENKVYVDIFRFDDMGKIIEHWDVAQEFKAPNQSGRTMIDGARDVKMGVSAEEVAANKKAVSRLFAEFFGANNKETVKELVTQDYLQHHPAGADGRDFLITLVDRIGKEGQIPHKVHRLIAEGDFVYAHVEYPLWNMAAIDIFRLESGKIAEHWDVLQTIPADIPHKNGMF